jgi:hypothetical protein
MSSKRRRMIDVNSKGSTSSSLTSTSSSSRASRRTSMRNCLSVTTSLNSNNTQATAASRTPSLNLRLQNEAEETEAQPLVVANTSNNMPDLITVEAAASTATTSAISSERTFRHNLNNNSNSVPSFSELYLSVSRRASAAAAAAREPPSPIFSVSTPSSPVNPVSFSEERKERLPSPPAESFKNDHSSNLLKILDSMRGDRSLCDYEIRVNGESFSCHKCILIAMSDFFRAMLTGSMRESRENFVELKGFSTTDGNINYFRLN